MPKKSLLSLVSLSLLITFSHLYAYSTGDDVLDKVVTYEYGQSREFLTQLNDMVVKSMTSADRQKEMELQLIKALTSDATDAAKEFICAQLSFIGSEKAVPSLIQLLKDEKMYNAALFALQRIPAKNVNEQLRLALTGAQGDRAIAIVNTLGERRDNKAVDLLADNLRATDSRMVAAAAAALGKIGGEQAASILKRAISKTNSDVQSVLIDAYLKCADQYKDEQQKALDIYTEVFVSDFPSPVRSAALSGIVRASGEKSLNTLQATIQGEDSLLQSTAIQLMRELPAGTDLSPVTAAFNGLSSSLKIQMLAALTDRKETVGRLLALQVLPDDSQSLRLAALKSLAVLGNARDVLLLAGIAAKGKGLEKEAARESLGRLNGQNINQLILSKIPDSEAAVKVELIHSIGRRNIKNATDLLFETIHSPQNSVRKESYQSLSIIADQNDFARIMDVLVNLKNKSDLQDARSLATKVALKDADSAIAVNLIDDKLSTINDLEIKSALLNILGKIGNDKALTVLRKILSESKGELKSAAIQAMALWPNKNALDDLFKIVQATESEETKRIALRGYIRIIGLDKNIADSEKVALYKKAMDDSDKINERLMIIRGLGEIETIDSMNLLSSYLDRDDLKMDIQMALIHIAPETARVDLEKTRAVLLQIIDTTSSDQQRETARTILDRISEN